MSVRLRRLQADYEQVKKGLSDHPAISIRGVSGNPPERYQIEYKIRSLQETASGAVTERNEHVAEVYLTLAYPRQAPQCRMLTPVFHPNIAPHAICIGDHWAAGEPLLNLIVRIGEMLAYQSYNVKSPLNGSAARWAEENLALLPTDPRDFIPASWSNVPQGELREDPCQNCHSESSLATCTNGHKVCSDCMIACVRCQKQFCLQCRLQTCSTCEGLVCGECSQTCPGCQRPVCNEHTEPCAICDTEGCPDCIVQCSACSRAVCVTHIRQCSVCRAPHCVEHSAQCSGCRTVLCDSHAQSCDICGSKVCPDCVFECSECAARVCVEHVAQCSVCRAIVCPTHSRRCSKCEKVFCADHAGNAGPEGLCEECSTQVSSEADAPFESLTCSGCGASLRAPRDRLGKRVKCPKCGIVQIAQQ